MLKGIDRAVSAELLGALMEMGHGDELLICDVNHPAASIAAHTVHGRVIDLAGCDIPRAADAILSLLPIDTFVDRPVRRMSVVGNPTREVPVHAAFQAIVEQHHDAPDGVESLERSAFYRAARGAFAVVRTSDPAPYGCFLLRKGVID